MEFITIDKPVSVKLMKEVILFHTGIDYNKQNTWTDLGAYFNLCMIEITKESRK